jgi:hypothetical protein
MANEKVSIEDIALMNDAQWQEYRLNLWNKKKQQYSADAPDWYMKDKDSYINFFETRKFQPKGITIEQIRNMNDLEWSEYRRASWAKKGEAYKSELPDWYLKDRQQFISFLKKNQKKY